jgi:stearoyl-CoA desaturase (delta-9 desaturase)
MLNTRLFNLACLAAIVIPFLGVLLAVALAWSAGGVGAVELAVCGMMFLITYVGVEVGFHRHFAHQSFDAPAWVRRVLGAMGAMACQGSPIWWAGVHRTHHQFADRAGDPHSPLEGLLRAHMTWLLDKHVNPERWTRRVRDLIRDPVAAWVHRRYPLFALLGFALPSAVVGVAYGTWLGALSGLLWGGLVRMFLVNHIIWSINSLCHCFGRQPYPTRDLSRNVYWLMLPSLGFSLHNNHHAFPGSATTAHVWWQLDVCGLVIRLLECCGLAYDVSVPSRKQIEHRRAKRTSPTTHTRRPEVPDIATPTIGPVVPAAGVIGPSNSNGRSQSSAGDMDPPDFP